MKALSLHPDDYRGATWWSNFVYHIGQINGTSSYVTETAWNEAFREVGATYDFATHEMRFENEQDLMLFILRWS